eukprot:411968-Pyramimonas_sp.AAC.1
MPASQLVRRHLIGAPAVRGIPVRTAVADHHPADQGAGALHNAGGVGMRGARITDVTANANATALDHPPGNSQTLEVSREDDTIDHPDHLPEAETDVVAEDAAAHVAATDHQAATEDATAVP